MAHFQDQLRGCNVNYSPKRRNEEIRQMRQDARPWATPTRSPDGLPAGASASDGDRFAGIVRDYSPADVARLAGSFRIKHTLAEMGARRLWHLLRSEPFVNTLGALTGNQAVQQVKAGLKAIYLSGWQVAADANSAAQMYPDQSLYPVDSVPTVVRRINNALRRCDQIARMEGDDSTYWMAPIVADAEAGFGGALNACELMRAMIEAGAAGVHFEDQLASEKKCGHLGGKVLIPINQHIRTLNAARLAADVEGVPTVLLCRTDSHSAQLLTADVDERDRPFLTGERTAEGFFRIRPGVGVEYAIARSLAYAPYADLLWWETSEPNLQEAEQFADAIAKRFPGKMLAYNCSPSFNWQKKLPPEKIAEFQRAIGAMGYKFQFVTLAGFHSLNYSMFRLARGYRERGMAAYSELQQAEFAAEPEGYTATRHQREVGVSYFDAIAMAVSGGRSSTTAFTGSTEAEQFHESAEIKIPQQDHDDGLVHAHSWATSASHAA
jgi:isocitrate lyase